MSEGWKEQIKLSVGHDPGYWDIEEVHSEIDRVYAQDTKADEYEAKAKAFDRIVKESKGTFSCGEFCDDVRHIINSYEIGVAKDD